MKNRLFAVVGVALFAALLLMVGCSSAQNASNTAGEMVLVPDLAGLTFEQAQAKLQESGLGIERQEQDSDMPNGSIISTTPASGEELAEGQPVVILVSRGPQMVSRPSLLGKSEADASAVLSSLGLQPNLKRNYSEQVKASLVYATEPAPDSSVAAGSTVTLNISLGSAYVKCGTCGGSGAITSTRTCPTCNGTGTCYT